MNKILIKNAHMFINTKNNEFFDGDILIEDGRIKKIAKDINEEVDEYIDAHNNYVSAGFIDSHVHAYPIGKYGMEVDKLGIDRYVSTVIDAGTSGSNNFLDFKNNHLDKAKTRTFVLLNLSKRGLEEGRELDDLNKLDIEGAKELIKQYPDIIVGLKARASKSAVGDMGIKPIEMTANLAHELNIPVFVHIGNMPPKLSDTLNLLNKEDIITHSFHGKSGGIIENNQIIKEAIEAKERGVYFDLGHGEESFSFETYKKARELNFKLDSISSDLHKGNYDGPVYSLIECMNKILNLGEELHEVIDKVTRIPAQIFKLKELGEIKEGYLGDLIIFKLEECQKEVRDSMDNKLIITKRIKPIMMIISKNNESEIY